MPDQTHDDFDETPIPEEQPAGPGILKATLKNVGVLVAMSLILLLMVSFMDLGEGDALQQRSNAVQERQSAVPERAPSQTARVSGSEFAIEANANGHFVVDAEVEGETIRFLVDTGASVVSLTPEDAELIGYHRVDLDFSERYQTANGEVRAAPLMLSTITIGPIEVDDVRASVNEAPMEMSLLGMSFLSRLERYEVRDDRLIMAK